MRKIQSFVRRSSRLTTSQQYALTHLADKFMITNFTNIWDNNKPIILEIGFGNGDSLLEMAINEEQNNFIGIEVYEAGVGRLINNINNFKLENLKIIKDDATEVLKKIPNNFLSGLQLYFPDPWFKRKHHKRRIICTQFLDLISQKIKPNGFIHIATDWQEYGQYMLTALNQHPSFKNTTNNFAKKPSRRPTTKFEHKGLKLGYQVWDLIFNKA